MERGKPRIQYERTYVLLPPDASANIVSIVVEETWDKARFTIGGSADDAGVGDVDARKVLALNPHEWKDDLKAFFSTFYPGILYIPITYKTEDELRLALRKCLQPPILGLNDPMNQGAGKWMVEHNVKGILYIPYALDYDYKSFDFTAFENAGIHVFLNLRFSWASADGHQGTLPLLVNQERFKNACIHTIRNSRGVYGWSLTNEANSPREWPKKGNGLEAITPARLAAFFASIREKTNARLSIGGFDPFNIESGLDPREWIRQTWGMLDGYKPDYVDVHGYIRGPDAGLVNSSTRFDDPRLSWQYLNYPGCFETLLEVLPGWAKTLPVICSEFNSLWKTVEPDWGWITDTRSSEIIRTATRTAAEIGLAGLCIYRWAGDLWEVKGITEIKNVIIELGRTTMY